MFATLEPLYIFIRDIPITVSCLMIGIGGSMVIFAIYGAMIGKPLQGWMQFWHGGLPGMIANIGIFSFLLKITA